MKMRKRNLEHLRSKEITDIEKHSIAVSRQSATESIVLLKNNDVLPLHPQRIALFGAGAANTVYTGSGSGDGAPHYFVTIRQGLEEAGFTLTSSSEEWMKDYAEAYLQERLRIREEVIKGSRETGIDRIHVYYNMPRTAVEIRPVSESEEEVRSVDTAVYVIARKEGEGIDRRYERGDYLPTVSELADLKYLRRNHSHLLVILNVAGVFDMNEINAINPDGILLVLTGGMETGHAAADIITGKETPSGKLATTWARNYWDYSNSSIFGNNSADPVNKEYSEGIYFGYRYFDTFNKEPLYPFGYGLSYTSFDHTPESWKADEVGAELRVKVTNTGTVHGREVVQLYLSSPAGTIDQPYQRLADYGKTEDLSPQESQIITLRFAWEDIASFDQIHEEFVLEEGAYVLRIGSDSRNTHVAAIVDLDGRAVLKKIGKMLECPREFDELTSFGAVPISYQEEAAEILSAPHLSLHAADFITMEKPVYTSHAIAYISDDERVKGVYLSNDEIVRVSCPEDAVLADVLEGRITMEQFISTFTPEELVRLISGEEAPSDDQVTGAASTHVCGAAGETTNFFDNKGDPRNIPYTVVADGPAGVRLIPEFQTDPDGTILVQDQAASYEQGWFADNEHVDGLDDYYQYGTNFPIGTAIASTWNKDLFVEIGDCFGAEMERLDVDQWLAPCVNLHRNPLCGRNFEYLSEDPYISGMCAALMAKGVQKHAGRGVTVKHFAVHNTETERTSHIPWIKERTLREVYLRNFELALKYGHPNAIMTSLNLPNGRHAPEQEDLCIHILRDEWGFDGVVMTDWCTTSPLRGAHTVACLKGGNDLLMPGSVLDRDLAIAALLNTSSEGDRLSLGEIQRCAMHVLNYIMHTSRIYQY